MLSRENAKMEVDRFHRSEDAPRPGVTAETARADDNVDLGLAARRALWGRFVEDTKPSA
jgi:hypothetical protein